MEDSAAEFASEIDKGRLQGLIYMEGGSGISLSEAEEGEINSSAESSYDCNEDDSVIDGMVQIPSCFIPDNFNPEFIHGNHYCVVCEIYPIVGYRLHTEHFKPSQGWPGEGCCHKCFKELFKLGTQAKREEWLIAFEPEQLETDLPLQSAYRGKTFVLDDHEQSDKENMSEEEGNHHFSKRSSPVRKIFFRENGPQRSNIKINSDTDETAEETFIESPEKSNVENQEEKRSFHILGTPPHDLTVHPRVLSPSLMESLLCFVPEQIACENFWLKYSSVRDGASLNTFQNFTRASTHTIMAIQTTRGDVFGSFTSNPWQIEEDRFGNGVSFVWKMRHTRIESCTAQQEEKIRVFPNSILNESVQLCTNELVGVGGGEILGTETLQPDLKQVKELGFAILLHDDLHRGTTSPSETFCSPMLGSDEEDGRFEVQNLEVWAFTPCTKVDNAERFEMKKYLRQNPRGLVSLHSRSTTNHYSLRRTLCAAKVSCTKTVNKTDANEFDLLKSDDLRVSRVTTSQKEDINCDGIEVTAFEIKENKGSIDISNNLNLPTVGLNSIDEAVNRHTAREKDDCCKIISHTAGEEGRCLEKASNVSRARSFFCCDDMLDSDDSIKMRESAQMLMFLKEQVVEGEGLANISSIQCDVDHSKIELSGDFSDFTEQIGSSSIEVFFTEKTQNAVEMGPTLLLGVDEFHDCQESTNEIKDSSLSLHTVHNDFSRSVESKSCDKHMKSHSIECANDELQASNTAGDNTGGDSFCDGVINDTFDVSDDLFTTPEKCGIDWDMKANSGEEQDTSHSFHTSSGGDISESADSMHNAAIHAKGGHDDEMKVNHVGDHDVCDWPTTSGDLKSNDDKGEWAGFPVLFSTPEKCIDDHDTIGQDCNELSVSTLFNTPGEFTSDEEISKNVECIVGGDFSTPVISKPSPVSTPEEVCPQESSEIDEEPCLLQNQEMKPFTFTTRQKEEVEKFCIFVKVAPVEVLKLNRERKWQKRYLTVSKEVTSIPYCSESDKYPMALLWVKKVIKANTYSIVNIDKHGRGGLAFTRMLRVNLELESDASNISPLGKHQRKKFSDSVVVTIDYQSDNSETSVVSLLCPKEAGELIVSSCSAIIDATMANTMNENPLFKSRFETMDKSFQCIDAPNGSARLSPKQLKPSPLGIEAHPYQQSHPIQFDDESLTPSDEDDASITPKILFKEVTELMATVSQHSKTINEDLGKENESILESGASIELKVLESKSRTELFEISLRESETFLSEKSEVLQDLETRVVDAAVLTRLLEASTDMAMEKSKIIINLEDRLATASQLRDKIDEASEVIAEKNMMIIDLNKSLAEALEFRKQLDYSKLELEEKNKVIDHLEERMTITSELQTHLQDANTALSKKREVMKKMEERLTIALEFEKKCNQSNSALVETHLVIKDLEERLALDLEVRKQLDASNATLLTKHAIIRDLEERLTMASNFHKQFNDSNDSLAKKNIIIDELEKRLAMTSEVAQMLDVANAALSEKSKILMDTQNKLDFLSHVQKQLNITNVTLTERNNTIANLEQHLTRSLNREEELSGIEETLSKKRVIVKDLVKSLETASEIKKQLDNANLILSEKGDLIADLERRLHDTLKLEVEMNKSQTALSEKTDQVLDLEKRLEVASEMEIHLKEVKSNLREKSAIIADFKERLAKAISTEENIDDFRAQLNAKSDTITDLEDQLKYALKVQKDLDDSNTVLSENDKHIRDLEERLTSTTQLKKDLGKSKAHVVAQNIIIKDLKECAANTSDIKERLDEAKLSLSEKTTIIANLDDRLKSAAEIQEQLDRSRTVLSDKCCVIEGLEKRLKSALLLEGQLEIANISLAKKSLVIQDLEKRAAIASEVRKELDEAKSTLSENMVTICSLEKCLEGALCTQKQVKEADATISENCIIISTLEQRLETASLLKEELDDANVILLQNINFIADQEHRLSAALLLEKKLDAMTITMSEKTKVIRSYEEQLRLASEVQTALVASNGKVSNLEERLTKALDECKCLSEATSRLNAEREYQNAAIAKAEEKVALLFQEKDENFEKVKTDSYLKETHYTETIRELEKRVSQCNEEMKLLGAKLTQSEEDAKASSVIIKEKHTTIQGLESKLGEMANAHSAFEQALKFDLAGVEASLSLAKDLLEELTTKVATIEAEKDVELAEVEKEKKSIAQNLELEIGRLSSLVTCSNKENIDLLDKLDAYDTKEEKLIAGIEGLKAATETVRANLDKKRNQISEMTLSSNKMKDHTKEMQNRMLKLESERDALLKKFNDAHKQNINLGFDIKVITDEKTMSEKVHEEQLQVLESEKDTIADELGCAIQLGMELDNAMERNRSEVAKLATQLDIQNDALDAACSKIEELLRAQEVLNISNADQKVEIQRMDEEEKLLKAEIAHRKEEIEGLANVKATDKHKIVCLQTELKTYEDKVIALEEQAVKIGVEHGKHLLKHKEDMRIIHEDAVQVLRNELGQQKKEELLLAAEEAWNELRQLQEECNKRLRISMEASEEGASKVKKGGWMFDNACDLADNLPGGRQYRGFCRCLLFALICAIVGRAIAFHYLPSNGSSRLNDYEQQALDMKQQLHNVASQANNDHIQVINIVREAMNHEVRSDLDTLESKRLGVLEQLGEGLDSDMPSPTASLGSILASQLFSDYLTLVISSYTKLTDEYVKTQTELEMTIVQNSDTSELKRKLQNLSVERNQERTTYETALENFRRTNDELESKLGDCSIEGVARMKDIHELRENISSLEHQRDAGKQAKIDEISYLKQKLKLLEREWQHTSASCTNNRALATLPAKHSRRRFGNVVRETVKKVFGDMPLKQILRDTVLMPTNADMLLSRFVRKEESTHVLLELNEDVQY